MTPALLSPAIVLMAAVAIGLPPVPAGTFGEEQEYSVPESFYTFESTLTKTTKALANGREIVIVILGGSSTLGLAAGGGSFAWPSGTLAPVSASGTPAPGPAAADPEFHSTSEQRSTCLMDAYITGLCILGHKKSIQQDEYVGDATYE